MQVKENNLFRALVSSLGFSLCLFLAPQLLAQDPGPVQLQGTGGTITTNGDEITHVFTTGGTFTPPIGLPDLDVLVVGGGGGGGGSYGGGGGAGGLIWQPGFVVLSPTYSVTIGNGGTGGAAGANNGTNGGNSLFGNNFTALGGGAGGGAGGGGDGAAGGSGGGGGGVFGGGGANTGGAGTVGQGNNGGNGNASTGAADRTGGGGGGAGAVGAVGTNTDGGQGGIGQDFSANFGTGVGELGWFAGGGGGGKRSGGGAAGPGGMGGGGAGGEPIGGGSQVGVAGLPNTGGGGGGAGGWNVAPGGDGGSGIVITQYTAPLLELTQEPSASATATVVFPQQPVIELLLGGVTPVAGINITASIESGGGTLGGTVTVPTNGSGQAVFSDLFINGSGNHTISFSPAGAVEEVVSIVINVTGPTLNILTQPPATAASTVAFSQQPVIQMLLGGTPSVGVNMTASIASGSGSLGGTTTVPTDGSGEANFTDLSIAGTGNHTISFSPAGFSDEVTSIIINVVTPTLSINTQPSTSTISGVIFPQQPVIELLAAGSPVAGVNITASIASGGGVLGGTVSIPTNGSGQAVFTDLDITGLGIHTLSFSAAGFVGNVISGNITVGLPFTQGCPGFDGTSSPVVFLSCTEAKVAGPNITQTITITTPPGVAEDDLLVAAIAIDESHLVTTTPAGWNLVFQGAAGGGGQAGSFNVFSKVATASEPASYSFTDTAAPGATGGATPIQAAKYGWIMHFTGVSGIADSAGTINGGQTNPGIAPSVTSTSDNNLILMMGGFDDRDIVELNGVDVDPLMATNAAYTTITMEDSHDDGPGNNGTSVSGGAAYLIQASAGASGTENFLAFSEGERWVTVSMALEPLPTRFEISLGGLPVSNCTGPANVTIRATDDSGNTITSYTGTINLETVIAGIGEGFGTWGIGTANGVLIPGGLNSQGLDDGTAQYTFDAADNGVATLTFSSPMAGTHNFNIADDDFPGIVEFVDPNLTVSFCATYEFAISNSGATDTCTPATVNFRVAATGGGATLYGYTGTISISNDINSGYWAIGTANGTLIPGSGMGTATYTFTMPDYSVAPLSFFSTVADPTINFDVTDGSFSEAGVDNELVVTECAGLTPNIGAEVCSLDGGPTDEADLTIVADATNNLRLVLMVAGSEGNVTPAAGAATFNGANMTLIARALTPGQGGGTWGNMVDIFAMLNNDLPSTAGTYTAQYSTGLEDNSEFCVLQITDVEQVIPLSGAGQPANITVTTGGGALTTTNITTTADDAVGFSGVSTGGTIDSTGQTLNFEWEKDYGGGGTTFIASSGLIATAGPNAITENFNAVPAPARIAHNVVSFAPGPQAATQFSISHPGTGGTCAASQITISAINDKGEVDTTYTGTINLSTTSGLGDWSDVAGGSTNSVVNLSNGDGTYTFDPADGGTVTLGFTQTSQGTVNFNVDDGTLVESAFFDPDLIIGSCFYRISHSGTGDTCTPESITIDVVDAVGNPATTYAGTINLTTTTGNGTWAVNTGNGTFNDPGADDGMATYTFDETDMGSVILDFTDIHVELVNFNVTGSGFVVDPGFDPDLNIINCSFRITHSGSADQCTVETVTITAVDSSGTPLTYTGTISLSTDTGNGTWSLNTGNGSFSDPIDEDGAASYTFDASDSGVLVLDLLDNNIEMVNINVTDGSLVEDPLFDPDLNVTACTFRITAATGSLSACTFETITIEVFDSGGALAPNYTGTVDFTTDTANGNWLATNGAGVLTDVNPNDGIGSYAFSATDGGSATFTISNETVETFNINLNDNGIIEDPGFDPDIDVSACLPTITDVQCYNNQSQLSAITVNSSAATGGSRMVLMYTGSESLVSALTATVDVNVMTELMNETANFGAGNVLQVYGILDADLPASAGTYDAAFTGSANTPSMCLVSLEGVAQAFPTDNGDDTGQINGSNAANTQTASTTITSVANNSIVLSTVLNGSDGSTYGSTLSNIMWSTGLADPAGSDWAGNSDAQPTTGLVTVDETNSGTPIRHAHIVLALAPIVAGDPYSPDYVPVSLFQTYSGNLNYRAIGNTLRNAANPTSCTFVAEATGTTADIVIPPSSTITASYLYWAGSGDPGDEDATVSFGPDGSQISITADDMYQILGAYGFGTYNYFAGYKDVTGLISTTPTTTYRFSDLTVQTGAPWNGAQACAGGWGMVVVYENQFENLNIINIFQGFQPFRFSSFQLVPRNFRMDTPDDTTNNKVPNGQITHISFEGDDSLNEPGELLELQNDPLNLTFTPLTNSVNTALFGGGPADAQYNDTVSYPVYVFDVATQKYVFDSTGGTDGEGYNIVSTTSWGTDVDTYYVQGAAPGEILYEFGNAEAEQITTRYGTGQDGVLLVGEFISVTNAEIADLEVFINESGTFKVGSMGTGMYSYTVTNNGNGAITGGFANGDVILTINLPVGMTASAITPNGWTCIPDVAIPLATAFTCDFDIIATDVGDVADDELGAGESLPDVEITVNLDDDSSYPLLNNPVTQSARIAHTADYTTCDVVPVGVQPDPTICVLAPQFDNVNDLNKNTIDIDDLDEKTANNNNVVQQLTTVEGIRTDLSINKSVVGVLEENQPAQYQVTVTNLGPDVTTKTMTVTDTLPNGLVPANTVGSDPEWSCNIVVQDVTCTRSAPLGVAATTDIFINTVSVVAPAIEGAFVNNTAVVQAGTYNFDQVPGNNSDTDITQVVGEPVASNEKFLITVDETSTIGGLGPFGPEDLVLYDPVLDQATMFLDVSTLTDTTIVNIDAHHLLPNGQILLSADADGSQIAGLSFNAEDIVLYDPILHTATLIFDGSTVFDADTANVDAIYVEYNNSFDSNDWNIIFSTSDDAAISAVNYDDNDLVFFDVSAGTPSITVHVDGASNDVYNSDNGDIDAAYIRFDNSDEYILSTDDVSVTIGISGTQDTFSRDDLVQLNLGTPTMSVATNVFLGDVANGIFAPGSGTRSLNGVHVIEDGYFGHFAIIHGGVGDTCTPTTITIRRHSGLTHTTDTNYQGSILITNDIADGTWNADVSANGLLTDMGGGTAVYTFEAADNGEVILTLTQTTASTVNVDVTNFFNEEDAVEDSDIMISNVVTNVSYEDQFGLVAYNNNDGIASFFDSWTETNDDGDASTGAVRVTGNKLNMTNPGGTTFPEIHRTMDFSGYTPNTVTDPLTLNFTWDRINGAPADTFDVEARSSSGDAWVPLQTFTGFTGAVGVTPVSIDMTAAGISPTVSTQIRFVLSAGYQVESFNIDNVEVTTATNDCNVGDTVDHYAISHSGFGVSCLATNVTITPHTAGDLTTEPGAGVVLTLNTSTFGGTWSAPINGTPAAFSSVPGTGNATYVFQAGESALIFPFNYTEALSNTVSVSINLTDDGVPTSTEFEDPTLNISRAGFRFFNDSTTSEVYPTLVAGMNSLLYTSEVLTLQAIRASDNNPAVCEDIFGPGDDVQVELAFECVDPAMCSAAVIPVDVTNNSNTTSIEPVDDNGGSGANPGGYDPITLRFETFNNGDFDQGGGDFTYTGAELQLNYADAGSLQIHGRYDIPLLDGAGPLSGDLMEGSGSNNFVVRPFGYDIDFVLGASPTITIDRETNGNDEDAASWADDPDDSAFFTAGLGFETMVTAIAWDAADDDGDNGGVANDGIPDPGADLFDNSPTPNYGNEMVATQNDMTITHSLNAAMPVGAVTGTLTTNTFTNFGANNGSETHSMTYNEVGIIDLSASLDSGSYLDSGEGITGDLLNVGRFIPADFEVSLTNLIDRPLFTPSVSPFTYMGEDFKAEFTLTARNAVAATTQNYFGDFAKLDTPGELSFYAIEDIGAGGDDIDYSARLATTATEPFPVDFSSNWIAGVVPLSGTLTFNRQVGEAPEAPITQLQIAMTAIDNDSVADVGRTVDDDSGGGSEPGPGIYNLIGIQEFRYGRIRLENAYGSEIPEEAEDADDLNVTGEDLPVYIIAEYYDGTEFVVNTDDVATPYSSTNLNPVDGSFTDNLTTSTLTVNVGNGVIYQGETEDQNVNDRPLYLTAPGEGNDGSAVIELDLTAEGLNFLRFDWRGAVDIEDENADGDYSDSPRAYIEFGTFLQHQRIINWQELFTEPP